MAMGDLPIEWPFQLCRPNFREFGAGTGKDVQSGGFNVGNIGGLNGNFEACCGAGVHGWRLPRAFWRPDRGFSRSGSPVPVMARAGQGAQQIRG
jgi:hypothetical protein